MMNESDTKAMIQRHEGFRNHVYKDSIGVLTVGYGHALHEGSTMPRSLLEDLFEYDYAIAEHGYNQLGLELDDVRRAALIDLIFNVGLAGVKRFKKMLLAIAQGDYETAADEIEQSHYYYQVGNRAKEITHMVRTGTAYVSGISTVPCVP